MQNETEHRPIDNEMPTCERCSPINYANFDDSLPGRSKRLFTIDDLSQVMVDQDCSICHILKTAIDVRRLQYPPILVYWDRASTLQGPMGTLRFQYSVGNVHEILQPELTVHDGMAINKPRIDFELAKTWVDSCKESHLDCNNCFSKELTRLRVIDCVTRSVVSAREDCVYVALSYVWGTSGVCDIPGSSALLGKLPLTVEHGISATLLLGYRYLWVDKYCIDQMNAADKHDQINQMGDIYSSAELTLIAAAGPNSAYGLPGVGYDREHLEHDVTVGRLRFSTTYRLADEEIQESVWYSRAWTFQEGYMSRRRLYFTNTQLLYICDKEVHCEAVKGSKLTGYDRVRMLRSSLPSTDSTMYHACLLLTEYTRRKLTFDSDALNATVGILNTLSMAKEPIFHRWGVTFSNTPLTIALQWFHLVPCLRRHAFPSWSPLGWRGDVEYYHISQSVISPSFQVDVWDGGQYIQLSKAKQNLLQHIDDESMENSRYLKITAKLGWLDLRYFSRIELLSIDVIAKERSKRINRPRPGFHVRVPKDDDDVEVYTGRVPSWDVDPGPCVGSIRVPCAIIPQDTLFEPEMVVVIMLRDHGTHYERIGSFDYPNTYWNEGLIFKDNKGILAVGGGRRKLDCYSDEELAKDFNDLEMQTFLLG